MGSTEVLSLLAVLVAVLSALATIRVYRRQVEVSTYQRATDLFMKLSEMFLAYPSLRPYFYDCKPLEEASSDLELNRVLVAAEIQLDVFDWVGHECEGASPEDRESWFEFIRSTFETSSVLWNYHRDHASWHPVLNQLLFGSSGRTLLDPTAAGATPPLLGDAASESDG